MTTDAAQSARASEISLNQLMLPEHANALGNVHGGVIMKMVDEAGAIAAMRHARRPCVTIAIDSMTFKQPVHVGQLMVCHARVTYVGRSSIEVVVLVHAENVMTREITHTNSAYVVYVSLGPDGKSTTAPALLLETNEDHRLFAEAATGNVIASVADASTARRFAARDFHREIGRSGVVRARSFLFALPPAR